MFPTKEEKKMDEEFTYELNTPIEISKGGKKHEGKVITGNLALNHHKVIDFFKGGFDSAQREIVAKMGLNKINNAEHIKKDIEEINETPEKIGENMYIALTGRDDFHDGWKWAAFKMLCSKQVLKIDDEILTYDMVQSMPNNQVQDLLRNFIIFFSKRLDGDISPLLQRKNT